MADLYEKSPVRVFEEASGGGLKAGELGLVTAKRGLGKTSVLVQFGMDILLSGRQLVHVSFNQHSENVISWYDGILNEISRRRPVSPDVKEQILRKRTILNFNQDNINLEKVVNTLNALKAGGTEVAGVVIDDVDLEKVKESDLQTVASYAKTAGACVWFSSTSDSEVLEETAPKALLPYFSIVVHLASKASVTRLFILKDDRGQGVESDLKLDSKTLLITK